MSLQLLDEHHLALDCTVTLKVNQRIEPCMTGLKQCIEVFGLYRKRHRRIAVAIEDGGDATDSTQFARDALSGVSSNFYCE
jgi:hypothetical protein